MLVQEMTCRMGVVTGKGLSALIRERFGLGVSFYLMLALVLTNVGNGIADFAGVAASAEIFGLSRYIAVPVGAFFLWHWVIKGTYKSVERLFFGACLFYITYIVSGFLAKPDWGVALRETAIPQMNWTSGELYMIVGIVGTTIAPWMQFYQQAAVVEKGIPIKHYAYSRLDTILGALVVTIVCFFIVLSCAATLHEPGADGPAIETAAEAAQALEPVAGQYCAALFAVGLLAASYFGATILPISTATSVCEAMGWERGVDKKFIEAPHYYAIYSMVIIVGVVVSLVAAEKDLIPIMLFSQVLNGMLLPVVVILMLRITNDRTIMGSHANGRIFNILAWSGVALVTLLSLAMVVLTLAGV
jgi:Mn2+/Fe2+ NRAMP family transporter